MALPGFLTDLNVLSIIAFLLILTGVMWRDRKNIERHSVVFVRRTKEGIHLLDDIADLNHRIWTYWANLGVIVGFVAMAGLFVLILVQTLKLFLVGNATPPVAPVLPTVSTVTNPQQAGYLGIPFWHFLIGISVVMVVHEMMHGVIARVEDFDIEYVGLILLGFIPGAFVQPEGQKDFFEDDEEFEDEEESQSPWDQGKWTARLRVLAAGPFANITLTLFLAALVIGGGWATTNVLTPAGVYQPQGMEIVSVVNDTAAERAGLKEGMRITAINGTDTRTVKGFNGVTENLKAGETVPVTTGENGTFQVTLGERGDSQGNYSFRPALLDYAFPTLERDLPGTIETYERYNDILIDDDIDYRIARWQWVAEQEPALADRAAQQVEDLESQKPAEEKPGYMGVMLRHEASLMGGHDWLLRIFGLLASVITIVAALNFFIGTANLLPIKGLDGGWMFSILGEQYWPEKEPTLTKYVTVATLAIILISFGFTILRFVI